MRGLSQAARQPWVHRLDGSAREPLRQCQGRELHEDAQGRGRLFDGLRNVRGCHRRSSPLHRRGLQHTQTTLSARLLEPRAIRGPPRSANGQNCRLILSSPWGALQTAPSTASTGVLSGSTSHLSNTASVSARVLVSPSPPPALTLMSSSACGLPSPSSANSRRASSNNRRSSSSLAG